jgi:hypothetical protein
MKIRKQQAVYIFGILLLLCCLFALGCIWYISLLGSWCTPFEECEIEIPSDGDRVIFMRKGAHWIYAEYNRKIKFIATDGKEVLKPLPMNTGGRTFINVYWYKSHDDEGPYLRLLDTRGEYLVDLAERTTNVVIRYESPRDSGRILTFAGPVQDKGKRSVGTYPDGVRASVDGRPAQRLTGQLAEEPGQYLGRLESRGAGLTFVRTKVPDDSVIDERFLKFHPLPWLQSNEETIPHG